MHKDIKTVYLGNTYHGITVNSKTFEQLKHFIEQNRICSNCGKTYTQENLLVAQNYCLFCFLQKEKKHNLTFLGLAEDHTEKYGYKNYRFISEDGYIYFSSTQSDSEIDPSIYQTIVHWGFPVPETYTKEEKEKQLEHSYWKIWGNFKQNLIIVIEYQERYGEHFHAVFLSNKKDNTVTELNKRRGYTRALFKRAMEEAEKTKDAKGYYHVGNQSYYQLGDSMLYPLLSDLASEDASLI